VIIPALLDFTKRKKIDKESMLNYPCSWSSFPDWIAN